MQTLDIEPEKGKKAGGLLLEVDDGIWHWQRGRGRGRSGPLFAPT